MDNERSAAGQWLKDGSLAIGRSFRLHRPRGAFCHRGWCQQCKVVDPNGEVRLACQEPAATQCRPKTGFDPLRIVGALAERLPPWAWERIAYRPSPWRQPFLGLIRRLSAAPRLPEAPVARRPAETRAESCDVLVVGGGLSGLVAAVTLAEQGRRVILVDAGPLGGSARLRPGDGVEVARWIGKARQCVEIREEQLCLGLYDGGTRAWCVGTGANLEIAFASLVVATGAYDRLPLVAGNDLPGVIGLRAFESLLASGSMPVRLKIGLYGDADEIRRAEAAALAADVGIEFAAGAGPLGAGSSRRVPDARLERIAGSGRGVRGIHLSGGRFERCDVLVVCESQPTYELQAQLGATIALRGPGGTMCALDVPSKALVVGEAAGWFAGGDSCERTREQVRRWAGNDGAGASAPWSRTEPSPVPRHSDDAFVCVCEDVRVRDVRRAIAEGYTDIELIKRHTGAGTGPCQGKLCHGAMVACAAEAGLEVRIPTPRPLARPIVLGRLVPTRTTSG